MCLHANVSTNIMGFSTKIKEKILVASARHCCVCHESKGRNLDVHHILPRSKGGEDTFENAIALCFDCHSNVGHYNSNHPMGNKFTIGELKAHKKNWFRIVEEHKIKYVPDNEVDISIIDDNNNVFTPIYVSETTRYYDRDFFKGLDFMVLVNKMKTGKLTWDHFLNKIETYDDFIEFMNGDDIKKYVKEDEQINSPQPIRWEISTMNIGSFNKILNRSVSTFQLKIENIGSSIIENYKLYLDFENFMAIECVDKRKDFFDDNKYKYNVVSIDEFSFCFEPSNPILVQNDHVLLDKLCFRTKFDCTQAKINWRLVAKGF